jgi:hypothetical protein
MQLPHTLRYEQLPSAAREKVRAYYEQLGAYDEPPYPAAGLLPIIDAAREAQASIKAKGSITLVANVDSRGDVTEVRVIDGADPDMATFMGRLITITKFKPARCAGAPCAMPFPFKFEFVRRD